MSPTDHPALLSSQLVAVLAELDAGHGDLREAACLAGQLERLAPDAAALDHARQRVDQAPAEMMLGEPFDIHSLAGDVLAADDPDAAADALLALDEACAGARFLGLTQAAGQGIRMVVAEIRAVPGAWSAQVPLARSVLERCRPVEGDPAGELWAAIAACPAPVDGRWGSVPLDGPVLAPKAPSHAPGARSGSAPVEVVPAPVAPRPVVAPRRRGLSVRRTRD